MKKVLQILKMREVESMSEGDKKNKETKILKIVDKILSFTLKDQKQRGLGLKILTLNQMLSRLPFFLAQLKAGNNSEKLKTEIRQLLYYLYRSKKLAKQLYKSLIDIIQKLKQSLSMLKIAKQVNHTDLNWI